MKKISNWLFNNNLELNKKWWHRFFKVLFIITVVSLTIFIIILLINSYSRIVNQWNYVDTVTARLNSSNYSGKIVSIKQLYSNDEVISTINDVYTKGYYPNLNNKKYLLPFSVIFLDDTINFCSDKLDKQIREIASNNNIKLFSTTNPTLYSLSTDVNKFISNLGTTKCVMIDSYSVENDNGTINKYTFLRPVDIYEYSIFKYKNNLIGYILAIIFSIIGLWMCVLMVQVIYYKIIMYIIYGNKK